MNTKQIVTRAVDAATAVVMTKTEALELIADEEYEPESYDESAEIFAAIIGRKPDDDDGDQGALWSHACAAAGAI